MQWFKRKKNQVIWYIIWYDIWYKLSLQCNSNFLIAIVFLNLQVAFSKLDYFILLKERSISFDFLYNLTPPPCKPPSFWNFMGCLLSLNFNSRKFYSSSCKTILNNFYLKLFHKRYTKRGFQAPGPTKKIRKKFCLLTFCIFLHIFICSNINER